MNDMSSLAVKKAVKGCERIKAFMEMARTVVQRLDEAGATLLALPGGGFGPDQECSSMPEIVREVMQGYGYETVRLRPSRPSPGAITRMDEAYSWLAMIPDPHWKARRVVALRSLFDPLSERHLLSWREVGRDIGASYHTAQSRHADGIAFIATNLL